MSPALWILRSGVAGVAFLALAVFVYTLASSPRPGPSYLGLRGLKRLRAQQRNPLFRELEPVLRWLGGLIDPLLSPAFRARANRQITLSGDFWGLSPAECCALTLLSGFAGVGAGLVFGALLDRGILYVILGALVGAMIPYLQLSGLEAARKKQIRNGLPHVIDLLALGISAGLDFPGALRQIVDKSSTPDSALVEEIELILQELQVGKTRSQALAQFAERAPSDSVREFVGAVIQADTRGNPLGHVLEIQADVSRQHRSTRAEEAASRAGVKMLVPMVLLFGAILMLIVAPMFLQIGDSFRTN
jgi:tight adherence protein C